MKSTLHLLPFLLLLTIAFSCKQPAEVIEFSDELITSGWQFKQTDKAEWMPATVPGCVHTDLLNNKIIEDPFYRTNERDQQWVDKVDWEYETSFVVDEEMAARENIRLFFEGLDTYAEVYLNGTPILSANNMFREWRVDCKEHILAGKNQLRIVFKSPINIGLQKLDEFGYGLPAVNDQSENGGMGDKKVSVFTRKAGYHYGWDWGPRFVTSGIWKPIRLQAWNNARIEHVQIIQDDINEEKAKMRAVVEVSSTGSSLAEIIIKDGHAGAVLNTKTVNLDKGNSTQQVEFEITDPKLWWTNGLGEPYLYKLNVELSIAGNKIDGKEIRTGIRTVELVQEPDSLGKSFLVKLNGVPVFMKGANYIPNDNFLDRVSPEDYADVIKRTVDANMNMLRVWGGGIYEKDIFYDLCDENGILVWQDFMFACSMYPGDEAFLENVRQEAIDNVKRLRNHACIALWCGNNEIDGAWGQHEEKAGWGWKKRYNEKQRETIWKAYDDLFHTILPEVIKTNDPSRFYWPSSPMADYGKHSGYHTQSGDIHYWGVWHGKHRFEEFKVNIGRFMSEYGFQSFPEFKTVKSYTTQEDWDIESEVMAAHQRSGIGNLRIKEYTSWYYKMPKDFESFLYVGQVLQAEGMKVAYEAHRRKMPQCMGTLYWQINDCWPVASWSSTDYYGRWKAQHYFTKKAYAEILVSPTIDDEVLSVYTVSDKLQDQEAMLKLELMNFSGRKLWEQEQNISVPANTSTKQMAMPIEQFLDDSKAEKILLSVKLKSKDGKIISENIQYFLAVKDLKLPTPKLDYSLSKVNDGVNIKLSTKKLAKNVYLQCDQVDGFFSDNYFDMLPGETATIHFKTKAPFDDVQKFLKVNDLTMTF